MKNLTSAVLPCMGIPPYNRDHITKWGGVYLDDLRAELMEDRLTTLLSEKHLIDLLSAVDGDTLSSKIGSSQWLLHRIPCETETGRPYGSFTFSLPSDYVRRRIQKKLDSGVNLSLYSNSFICGNIYESGVFKYLENCRVSDEYLEVKLHDKRLTSDTQKLMISAIEDYSGSSPIQRPEYTLYKPRERNKKGLDAVLVQSSTQAFILQITINERHPKLKIDDAFQDFPSVTEWFVCCIYPTDIDDFHFPTVSPDNRILKKYIHQHSNVHSIQV